MKNKFIFFFLFFEGLGKYALGGLKFVCHEKHENHSKTERKHTFVLMKTPKCMFTMCTFYTGAMCMQLHRYFA
jgi:hypothetical protein